MGGRAGAQVTAGEICVKDAQEALMLDRKEQVGAARRAAARRAAGGGGGGGGGGRGGGGGPPRTCSLRRVSGWAIIDGSRFVLIEKAVVMSCSSLAMYLRGARILRDGR